MRLDYFQLVDRVVSLSLTERRITAEAAIPAEHSIFQGHFPGYPLMPGVLLIEAMAQTSGWLIIANNRFAAMPFLAQVKDAKLRRFVLPGSLLTVSATLTHDGSGFAVTQAEISSATEKCICEAEIRFRVVQFPSDDLRGRMRATAEQIGLPMEEPAHAPD